MTSDFNKLNRSASHLTAFCLKRMFPQVTLLKGGLSDIGFYYDFCLGQPFGEALLPFLEQNIRTAAKENIPFRLQEMTRKNAIEMFRYHGYEEQVEALENCSEQAVQVLVFNDFIGLCDGDVLENSGAIKALKLLSVSKKDEDSYRIEGVCFSNPMELKTFVKRLDALRKCDHRTLSREMQLYEEIPEVSGIGGFWLPRGLKLREDISERIKQEYRKKEFKEIETPIILNTRFLEKIRLNTQKQYKVEESQALALDKHVLHANLFNAQKKMPEQSPLRFLEIDQKCCKETSQWGFFKKNVFLSDTGTIFCLKEQLSEEIISSLQMITKFLKILGFEYCCYLLLHGRKNAKTSKSWNFASNLLEQSVKKCSIDYKIDETQLTFEGPKLEFRIKDSLNREWTGPYICVNLELPGRLALNFYGKEEKIPAHMLMISLSSSIERLIGLVIEKSGGKLPFWLAPEQVKILVVGEKNVEFAKQVFNELVKKHFRVALDRQDLALGSKIHEAEQQRIPYLVLVGENEEKNNYITVRTLTKSTDKQKIKLEEFFKILSEEFQPPFDNEE